MNNISQMTSNKSKRLHNYLLVDALPTGFRSYTTNKIYVRGLFLDELLSLSKLTTYNLKTLVTIFEDVIHGIDIDDLELTDFLTLVSISSLYTLTDVGWNVGLNCSNTSCKNTYKKSLTLFDLSFDITRCKTLPIPVVLYGEQYELRPLTIKDNLFINSLKSDDDKEVIKLARMLTHPDYSFDDMLVIIKTLEYNDSLLITSVVNELTTSLPLFDSVCPKCNTVSKFNFNMDVTNILPHVNFKDIQKIDYLWHKTFNCNIDSEKLFKDVVSILEIHAEEVNKK